jgi:hypothetical protein
MSSESRERMTDLTRQDALRRAKKADRDEPRELTATPKRKLTKRQAARLEVKRARRGAKPFAKRYHADHLRWIMLRQEKRKMCAELRKQFKELSEEVFALSALMKESALRLKNALTSWGDSRTRQSEKALALADGLKRGFADGYRVAKEEMAAEEARHERRTPNAKPAEKPEWMYDATRGY